MARFTYERGPQRGLKASRVEDKLEEDTLAGLDLIIDEDAIENETGSVFVVYRPNENRFVLTRGPQNISVEYNSILNVPRGDPNGLAPLDSNGEVPEANLPDSQTSGGEPGVTKEGTEFMSWAINIDEPTHVRLKEVNGNLRVVGESSDTNFRDVRADVVTANSFVELSSRKYKDEIRDLEAENVIDKLRPVRFERDGREDIGLVAEEVEECCPELVLERDGVKAVNYSKLSVLLLDHCSKLEMKMKRLKSEVEELKEAVFSDT